LEEEVAVVVEEFPGPDFFLFFSTGFDHPCNSPTEGWRWGLGRSKEAFDSTKGHSPPKGQSQAEELESQLVSSEGQDQEAVAVVSLWREPRSDETSLHPADTCKPFGLTWRKTKEMTWLGEKEVQVLHPASLCLQLPSSHLQT
jgi:hypothetical protein